MGDDGVQGAEEQIPKIYASDSARLYRQLARKCGADLAQDIAQETWLRAIREWRKKGLPVRPASWLATVSRNLLFNEFRSRRSMKLQDVDPETIAVEEAKGGLASAEREVEVKRALARLQPQESRLLEAFYLERSPVSKLAATMGISSRAVEGRLRRARAKLRDELAAESGGSPGHYGLSGRGVGLGINLASVGRIVVMSLLLPLLVVVAIFPLTLLTKRLPRRTLAAVRVVGGIGMFVLATTTARHPRALQAVGVTMLLWGIWMLVTPSHLSRTV